MATRNEPFAPGTPCWVDLATSDVETAKKFYGSVFGWTYLDGGEQFGHYQRCLSGESAVAGMMQMDGGVNAWCTYLATADIDATFAAATGAGAQTIAPPMQVGEFGSMALLSDPAGAAFGLWQADQHLGFYKYNEPGSVTWDEHHSKDFPASLDFYTKVFGWTIDKTSDTDEFRYFQGQINGETVAGLMDSKSFLPPEVPSHWAVYFSVEDVDATIEKVKANGGTVLRGAEDTPFGRIADLLDSTGAAFKLHSAKLANQA